MGKVFFVATAILRNVFASTLIGTLLSSATLAEILSNQRTAFDRAPPLYTAPPVQLSLDKSEPPTTSRPLCLAMQEQSCSRL
jgi:hypothetical protein